MILSYNLKIKIYGYHYIHAVCLFSSTAYSIIVTVLNEFLQWTETEYPSAVYIELLEADSLTNRRPTNQCVIIQLGDQHVCPSCHVLRPEN